MQDLTPPPPRPDPASPIRLLTEEADGAVPGRIYTVEPTGDLTYAHVHIGREIVVASVAAGLRLAPDDPVWIALDQDRLHLFDRRTEQSLGAA